jgi:hypothetical protein
VTGSAALWLARHLAHEDTVARVLLSTIADVQHDESATSLAGRARSCVLIWAALAGAVWHDLAWDRRPPLWLDGAATLGRLGLIMAAYQAGVALLLLGLGNPRRSMPVLEEAVETAVPALLAAIALLCAAMGGLTAVRARVRPHAARAEVDS